MSPTLAIPPKTSPNHRRDGGWSFVELIGATAIVGIAMLVMLQQMTISYRETGSSEDKVFAYQKALAIASELQSSVERGIIADALQLEDFDDHGEPNPVLTTLLDSNGQPVLPDHMMSGNLERGGDWLWWRTVSVEPMQASDRMRYVRVTVKRRMPSERILSVASLAVVINLPVDSYSPTSVFDVYALAIGTMPASSDTLAGMRSSLDGAVATLRSKSPGLDFRVHWITSAGYGRDTRYVPYFNTGQTASSAASKVYWYPSEVGDGKRLFAPEFVSGRLRTDDGVLNDLDSSSNPFPYAVADRNNHCLRAPAARKLHTARVLAGVESINEPPLQLLLEDMWANPEDYRNAIFVNLHGEALPCPPLRNISDAAASSAQPGVRAVTHPETLWTARDLNGDGDHTDTQDMAFRVYAYQSGTVASADTVDAISLQILGLDLTGNVNGGGAAGSPVSLTIQNLAGGVDRGGSLSGDLSYSSGFKVAKHSSHAPAPREMFYEIGYTTTPRPHTWIRLRNTPAVAPLVGGRGLHQDARLFGLEYVPSPVVADGSFSANLSLVDTAEHPKNTARWRIVIPKEIYDTSFVGGAIANENSVITVSTRLGAQSTSGVMWPTADDPANLSETYSWWSSSPDAIPPTERYQILGDPRLNPYADLASGGASFPHGYNRCFDDLNRASMSASPDHWPCLDVSRMTDGGPGGNVIDEARLMSVWRSALQACGGVLTHAEGLLAGSTVIGGEISGPRGDLGSLVPGVIAVSGSYFGLGAAQSYAFDALAADPPPASPAPMVESSASSTSAFLHGRTVVVSKISDFWAKPWLGELAPDGDTEFELEGNLSTTRFRQDLRELTSFSDLPTGSWYGFASGSRSGRAGPIHFVAATTTTGGPFEQVQFPSSTAIQWEPDVERFLSIVGVSPELPMPLRWPIRVGSNPAFVEPDNWGEVADIDRGRVSLLESLGTVGGFEGVGGGIFRLGSQDGSGAGYVVVHGVHAQSPEDRQRALAQSLALGVRAVYVAGSPAYMESVDVMPSVRVVAPSGSETVTKPKNFVVRWQTPFLRFDGKPYTSDYVSGYVGNESALGYVVLYSGDDGETWLHTDGATATLGEWPGGSSAYLLPDAGAGDESFVLSTPGGSFPPGEYLIRVECFHGEHKAHYAHHQQTLVIDE